jgi:hypothetical protein
MNPEDKLNLNFLLASSPKTLKEWYDTTSQDDIIYATELLYRYANRLYAIEINQMGNEIRLILDDDN